MKKLLFLSLTLLALCGCKKSDFKEYHLGEKQTLLVSGDIYSSNQVNNGCLNDYGAFSIVYRTYNTGQLQVKVQRLDTDYYDLRNFYYVDFTFNYSKGVNWQVVD